MSFVMTVYHNVDSRFFEFEDGDMLKPTDRLCKVIAMTNLPETLLLDVDGTLENIFMQLNMDQPSQDWAKAYRAAGHRSLSVGDVVTLGERAFAVANVGFKPCSISEEQVVTKRPPDVSIDLPQELAPE